MRLLTLFVALSLLPAVARAENPAPAARIDNNDPLLRALQDLQQELDGLRKQLREPATSNPQPDLRRRKTPIAKPQPAVPGAERGAMQLSPAKTRRGAVAPLAADSEPLARAMSITVEKSDHWSFQPVASPQAPAVEDEPWIRDDLDRFILARLEQARLKPNRDADRYTLLRRVAFDLTGLPPTEAELRAFAANPAPLDDALADVVDAYLASPRFGERWGRHWLDVVRYADSVGRNWNAPFTYAWRYRDYVIDSLNRDKPYDRFVLEQLAGDLLPAHDLASRREKLIATGFLALGPIDIIEPEGEPLMMDRIDEQIDVTTRALLGLTVACARCHDHKYEPVTMRDYYALAGIFYSTETRSGQRRGNYVADDDLIVLPSADGRADPIPGIHSMADITQAHRTGGYREVLWTTDPNLAMAAIEGQVQDCPIRLDGEAHKRGTVPLRGDFQFAGLSGLGSIPADSSGRLELAHWVTSPKNPLTARVIVNRVWQHLFGRGLVETVDNFGRSGGTPTHPELLDHLATRFTQGAATTGRAGSSQAQGSAVPRPWSIKSLIRAIVLSRTYRLSSEGSSAAQRLDPANELYWRMNMRRLEVEALRDSMISVAGQLTFERPPGIQVAGTGGKGRWGGTRSLLDIDAPYRTVYLPVLRSLLPELYSTFDFPDPNQVKGQREVTTVAPQTLFLMNSDFAAQMASAAADRVLNDVRGEEERVRVLYLRLLGRWPEQDEVRTALAFMNELTVSSSEPSRWSALTQALMICGEFRTLL